MNGRPAIFPTLLALLALLPVPTGAATYVSNFSEPYQIGRTTCPPPDPSAATSFTTDGANYVLNSVTVKVHSDGPNVSLNLRIRADWQGRPAYLLEDLGSVIVPVSDSEPTFTSAGLFLAAHTTYWVCVGEIGTGTVCYPGWKGTYSHAQTSIAGWTIGDDAVSSRDTLGWSPGSAHDVGLMRIDAVPAAPYVTNAAEANELAFAASPSAFSASSFTIDAQDYVMTNLTVQLNSEGANGSASVRLRADDGGKPGALIENFGPRALPAGESLQTFVSTGAVLAASTIYWITVGEAGAGDVTWRATSSPAQTSRGAWSVGDQSLESADGVAWTPIDLGPSTEAGLFSVDANRALATGDSFAGAGAVELSGAFPNPSSGSTRIEYALPVAGHVRLTVHDLRGRLVATLRDGDAPAGRQTSTWNGAASSGVYFVRLELNGTVVKARAIVLTK